MPGGFSWQINRRLPGWEAEYHRLYGIVHSRPKPTGRWAEYKAELDSREIRDYAALRDYAGDASYGWEGPNSVD
jgi:hypothetical protein